jgi:hypothetical protein
MGSLVCKIYTGIKAVAGKGDKRRIFFKAEGNKEIGTILPERILRIWLIPFRIPSALGL